MTLKSENNPNGIIFLNNNDDEMWQKECQKLTPWIFGHGVDIGCGMRSIREDIIRVDIDKNVHPDFCCSADKLPIKDEDFDFVTSIHSLEHVDNQYETLKEWFRILKKGGIIGIVHPDVEYTKPQTSHVDDKNFNNNPYNHHFHENSLKSFLEQLKSWQSLSFRILDSGVACPGWSFYVILEKI